MLPIHIALTFTDSHWARAYCTARSICVSAPDPRAVTIHMLHQGLEPAHKAELEVLITEYGVCLIDYNVAGHPELEQIGAVMPINRRYPLITYARWVLDRVLPPEIERVLYMDCDVLVIDDFTDLFRLDLEGAPMAAVSDINQIHHRLGHDLREDRLMPGTGQPYFNAGVLLLDMPAIRAADVPAFARKLPSLRDVSTLFFDQDLGNIAFHGRWKRLNWRYNVMNPMLPHRSLSPVILHFTGDRKPWKFASSNAYARLYRHMMTNRIFYGEVVKRWRKVWWKAPAAALLARLTRHHK